MNQKALLSFSRKHFDPTGEEQKFYASSISIMAKGLYDGLMRAGYEVEYIDATETPAQPGSYAIFVGQPMRWMQIANECEGATKVLFMPTSHPSNRNALMREARKRWSVPHDEELLGESPSDLQAFELADYVIQVGNQLNIDALLRYGVPREKILHVHYGLPPEWAAQAPRAQGNLDAYIHTAAEMGLRKGLPALVKAFSEPAFAAKHLTLVGEIRKNENHAHWLAEIESLKKHNPNAEQLGFIDASSKKYAEITAQHAWYLFPSIEEGEPGTVLEAMALGLVPILTRLSDIDFAIDDDFSASFEESLAKTLRASKAQWEALSAKAQRYLQIFHDHGAWERRLAEIFSSLHAGEKDLRPSVSIIVTVHDKEKHIVRLLRTLLEHSRSYPKWDLHIVYDGCKDASRAAAQEALQSFPVPVFEYETPDVWEVKANNHGLKQAQGKYCIILQDDNFIYEPQWLEKMLSWLEQHPKVGILGGLAGVNFFNLDSDVQGEGVNRSPFEVHQRFDPAADKKLSEYVFEVDAVMRGPIVLRKELLEKHGYFDEAYAPYYNDDMDYCFRMRSLGYGVFCYPINAINESLTVAKYNPAKEKFWRETSQRNQKLFYERWKDDIERHHPLQLKVPKPLYAAASPRRSVSALARQLRSLQEYELRKKTRAAARAAFLRIPAPAVRALIAALQKAGARSLAGYLHTHYFEAHTIPWHLAQGEATLRLQYPLDATSVIVSIGEKNKEWAQTIASRYGSHVYAAESATPEVAERLRHEQIDLLSLWQEGGEYGLLEELLADGSVKNIKNIQVKFDDKAPHAKESMRAIRRKLRETHAPTYQYEFVWENWERK